MLALIIFLIFCTVGLISFAVVPAVYNRTLVLQQKRQQRLAGEMEQLLSKDDAKRTSRRLILAPVIGAGLFYLLFPPDLTLMGVVLGFTLGLILPSMYVRYSMKKTRDKFNDQLMDALMIMSSSFRGGLSLTQAIETVVEEMPDPINREFGIVLGENKMGVSLDEALYHLYNRVPSTALQQMITAILLARETGGNLPIVFARIVNNIREQKKIQQNIDTLTLQGKIQGVVMSLLPIVFAFLVYSANRRVFDHMITSQLGRSLLMIAAILETLGVFMIWRISTSKDY